MAHAPKANTSTSLDSTAPPAIEKTTVVNEHPLHQQNTTSTDVEGQIASAGEDDAFGNEEGAEVQYKTCKWWYVLISIAGLCHCLLTVANFLQQPH